MPDDDTPARAETPQPHQRRRPPSHHSPAPGWRVEGGPPPAPRRRRVPGGAVVWWIVAALFAVNWIVVSLVPDKPARARISYTVFVQQVQADNVAEVTSVGASVEGTLRAAIAGNGARTALFRTEIPSYANTNELAAQLDAHKVVQNANPLDSGRPLWQDLLLGFGPTILLVGLFVWLMRRAAATAGGGLMGLGRSRARRYGQEQGGRVTFADVAGIDEARDELVEIVDFLKSPQKYGRLGGVIPKGVLLSGLPGTGKTLLARAVAGEAGVPFFSMSASEFVEMIVGVGASRVRDLFQQAKAAAPAIIFIDELDAIGRSRAGSSPLGGSDEREQTLNQILTEMDGFTGTEGVIVLAATNRPEVLDPALLRPGRFDRHVIVNPPDQTGRRRILEVHTRGKPLADDVSLDQVASSTPGMVGADLRNVANEAALMAARRGHESIRMADFTDALEKIVLGTERRIVISPKERERTAYHESGHALLGMLQPGADPVRKVSIIPRGRALGVTFQSPDADRYGYDSGYLRGRIIGMLGGRAAEELVYGDVTTGAESDLEQITRLARLMVGRWGMSEAIGPISVMPGPEGEPLLFPGAPGTASEATRRMMDEEVRRIVDECYDKALSRLREERPRLDALARALLEHETLDEADAYAAAGVPRAPRPADAPA